ncbi:ATP-binding protein [Cochlodiniinecator piscidefendens]|uniref:ATP-binding protein n=1 Tax=Cochlodiniinecator piscidefendens TaxID=2715756 RepID=UPI00140B2DEE|nr:ATP-binding protein [Cochlodiniinecator piscidefendens]
MPNDTLEAVQMEDRVKVVINGSNMNLWFTSEPETVRNALCTVTKLGSDIKISEDISGLLELVLAEILNNIVEHAYQEQPDGPIELAITVSESKVHCILRDSGVPMPGGAPPERKEHDLEAPLEELPEGGFGWGIVRDLVQDLQYNRVAHENVLSFELSP